MQVITTVVIIPLPCRLSATTTSGTLRRLTPAGAILLRIPLLLASARVQEVAAAALRGSIGCGAATWRVVAVVRLYGRGQRVRGVIVRRGAGGAELNAVRDELRLRSRLHHGVPRWLPAHTRRIPEGLDEVQPRSGNQQEA